MAYRIVDHTLKSGIEIARIAWDGVVTVTADGAMEAEMQPRKKSSALDAAVAFLEYAIGVEGLTKASEIAERAEREGHSRNTLKRAKAALDIGSTKMPDGSWTWQMPADV